MACVRRHSPAIVATLLGLAGMAFAPALAQFRTDLYDHPTLAIDAGMHTAKIHAQAVDAKGRFAVTGGDDRTVRIWSVADGKLLRTIWIPIGPEKVGDLNAVAISPDGSTIAAGGWTETLPGDGPIYLFDRESGNLIRRIHDDLSNVTFFLTFSPDGRYLAATLGGSDGLRVFDRDKDWSEAFRDDQYRDESYGASFARDGHLATTSFDSRIRLYQYDPANTSPNFHRVGEPVQAPSGGHPYRVVFSPDGKRLAVGYAGVAVVDILDGTTLARVGGHSPTHIVPLPVLGTTNVEWSRDGQTLFADGAVEDAGGRYVLFAWDRGGLGDEQRMAYCAPSSAAGVDVLPDGLILVASLGRCLGVMSTRGEPIWTVASPVLDFREQRNVTRVSKDGQIVDFGIRGSGGPVFRFDVRSLTLSSPARNDGLTFAPNREGLMMCGLGEWRYPHAERSTASFPTTRPR